MSIQPALTIHIGQFAAPLRDRRVVIAGSRAEPGPSQSHPAHIDWLSTVE
jgi:hypothetical protein